MTEDAETTRNEMSASRLSELESQVAALQAERNALQEQRDRYHNIIQAGQLGFACCRLVLEDPVARDFFCHEANPLFEEVTGMRGISGKRISEVFPRIKTEALDWFELFVRVAQSGQPEQIECQLPGSDSWLSISVISPQPGAIIIVAEKIISQKHDQAQLAYQATLLANVSDAIIAADRQYRVTYLNSAAEVLYGWSAREVLGKNGVDIIQTQFGEAEKSAMLQAIARHGYWHGEATQQRKNGSRFPVEVSSLVLHDADGHITGYLSINRDISERKKLENKLRESEERFRLLFENMHEGFSLYQAITTPAGEVVDLRLLAANAAYETHTGLKPREVIGKTMLEVVPMTGQRQVELYANVIKTGQPLDVEYYSPVFQRHLRVRAFRSQPGHCASIIEDVTALREAEQTLRESEQKYRVLYENEIYATVIFDQQTRRILDANDTFLRVYGYHRADLEAGLLMLDLSAEVEATTNVINDSIQEGKTIFVPLRYQRKKNGQVFPTEIVGGPFSWHKQKVFFSIIHDISERKNAQDALSTAHEQLKLQMEEVQKLQAELREQAVRDAMTGLYNRRFLNETLPRELARAEREEKPLSLIIADIDLFKNFNDTYGHQVGDQILIEAANLIQQFTRSSDLICRYGGEEFLIALPDTSQAGAWQHAEELRRKFLETVFLPDTLQLRVSLSFGLATFPEHGATLDQLITNADEALYTSKKKGRNCVSIWKPA